MLVVCGTFSFFFSFNCCSSTVFCLLFSFQSPLQSSPPPSSFHPPTPLPTWPCYLHLCAHLLLFPLIFWLPSVPHTFLAWKLHFFLWIWFLSFLFFFPFYHNPFLYLSQIAHNMLFEALYLHDIFYEHSFAFFFFNRSGDVKRKIMELTFIVPLPKVCVFLYGDHS